MLPILETVLIRRFDGSRKISNETRNIYLRGIDRKLGFSEKAQIESRKRYPRGNKIRITRETVSRRRGKAL